MHKQSIDNTALLVIDIQDSFKTIPERWAQRSTPAQRCGFATARQLRRLGVRRRAG